MDGSIKTQKVSQVPNMNHGRELIVWAEDFIVGQRDADEIWVVDSVACHGWKDIDTYQQ